MRTVELDYADPPPTAYDLDLQVALTWPEITTDETALVHVGLKNLAATERTVQVGSFVPFSAYDSVDEDPGLALLPATRETERESDDCWTVGTDVIWEPLIEDFVDLAPCEAVWGAFELWNHPDNDACLPPGEYRFESPYELGAVTETDSAGFYWGFELRVREA